MWVDPSVSIRDSELKVQRVFASEEAYLFILASPCLKEFPHAWRIQVSGADPSFQRRASGDAEDVVSSLMCSATPHSQHHLLVLRFCTRDTLRLRIDYWTDKRGYWFAVAFLCVQICMFTISVTELQWQSTLFRAEGLVRLYASALIFDETFSNGHPRVYNFRNKP